MEIQMCDGLRLDFCREITNHRIPNSKMIRISGPTPFNIVTTAGHALGISIVVAVGNNYRGIGLVAQSDEEVAVIRNYKVAKMERRSNVGDSRQETTIFLIPTETLQRIGRGA